MKKGLPSGWTRRDWIAAVLPAALVAVVWFLFTTAHACTGLLLHLHGGFLVGLLAILAGCEIQFFVRGQIGFGSCKAELLWLAAFGIHVLMTGALALSLLFHGVPREVHRREVPGRGTFAILEVTVLKSGQATLAGVVGDSAFVHVYRPLARNSLHTSERRLVRPERHGQGEGRQIHVAPDGLVAGFERDSSCLVAWDPASGAHWGSDGAPVGGLPLFRLIGKDGGLVEEDVRSLELAAAARARNPKGDPDPGADPELRDALSHPNPAVRAAARRIVDAGGPEVYPEASKVPR